MAWKNQGALLKLLTDALQPSKPGGGSKHHGKTQAKWNDDKGKAEFLCRVAGWLRTTACGLVLARRSATGAARQRTRHSTPPKPRPRLGRGTRRNIRGGAVQVQERPRRARPLRRRMQRRTAPLHLSLEDRHQRSKKRWRCHPRVGLAKNGYHGHSSVPQSTT